MKLQIRQPKMRKASSQATLDAAIESAEEFYSQGYNPTVRQIYYSLVSKDLIANNDPSYQRVIRLLTEARYEGLLSWDVIEDRSRDLIQSSGFDSSDQALASLRDSFRLDRMFGQPYAIEVWSEKDAISNILYDVVNPYGIPLVVCRGFLSVSFIYDAAKRVISRDCPTKVLYAGDYDPSGMQMPKDIVNRMQEFLGDHCYLFSLERIAITNKQILQFNPPPNPVKPKDSNAKKFYDLYGKECFEVDALSPSVLKQSFDSAIHNLLDFDVYQAVLKQEEIEREKIR